MQQQHKCNRCLGPAWQHFRGSKGKQEGGRGIYKANEKKRSIKKILHLLKHLIFFAPFLTFYYYAFNVQTFCYAFAPPSPSFPAPSCSLAANPTQCAFIPFASSPIPVASHSCCLVRCLLLPFGRIYSHAMSPRNLPRLPLSPAPCTLCQPVAVALQQLRRIAASGFVATKAFVANNFTSLTRSPSISLSTALLQLECVLSADTMRE